MSGIKHVPFSSANALTLIKAKIKPAPLTLILTKIPDIKSLGLVCTEGTDSKRLTVDQTRDLISLIRSHVSFSVSIPCIQIFPFTYHHFQTEAGCRILVNAILLHVVSNLSGNGVDVGIVPGFRMEMTRFEYAATSYGGTVDFLIVKGPPSDIGPDKIYLSSCLPSNSVVIITEFILKGPKFAFTNPEMVKHISSNIYGAKRDGFRDAVPQAVMAAVSYCRQHR